MLADKTYENATSNSKVAMKTETIATAVQETRSNSCKDVTTTAIKVQSDESVETEKHIDDDCWQEVIQ